MVPSWWSLCFGMRDQGGHLHQWTEGGLHPMPDLDLNLHLPPKATLVAWASHLPGGQGFLICELSTVIGFPQNLGVLS